MISQELKERIRNLRDVSEINGLLVEIIKSDRSSWEWTVEELFRNAAALGDKESEWSHRVFQASIKSPIRKSGKTDADGQLLRIRLADTDPVSHWKDLPSEAFEYYWRQSQSAPDPIYRVQYLCALWESKSIWAKATPRLSFDVPQVVSRLVDECIEAFKVELKSEEPMGAGMRATEFLEIAAFVGVRLGTFDSLKEFLPNVRRFAESIVGVAPHWTLGLAEVIVFLAQPDGKVRNKTLLADSELSEWEPLMKTVQDKYDAQYRGDPEEVLEILVKIQILLGAKITRGEYEERLAQRCLKRTELPLPNMVKASLYKEAAAHFLAAGMRAEAANMKQASREAIQRAIENKEFKRIEVSQKITPEDIEKSLGPFFDGAENAIDVLLRTTSRIFAHSLETGRPIPSGSALLQFMSTIPIVGDRVKATQTPDGGNNEQLEKENLVREIDLYSQFPLSKIFSKLRDEYDLSFEDLFAVLFVSEFWMPQDLPFIKRAIQRYLADDFISFMHIIVPRLEQLIRNMLKAVGADITALKNDSLVERPLGELLQQAEEKKLMPESLTKLLRALLSEEWGFNLRNRVAHGWITNEECDATVASRVLHTAIVLNHLFIEQVPPNPQ